MFPLGLGGVPGNPTLGTLLIAADAVDVPLSQLVAGLQIGAGTGRQRSYSVSQFVNERRHDVSDG